MKYAWQQAVLDAFDASSEFLPVKINIAQKAIAARQQELSQPEVFERIAIREALQGLGKLVKETRANFPRQSHFHIRWSEGKLDWERFSLRAEAEASATQLVRLNETYAIEEFDDKCAQCRASTVREASA